MSKSGKIVKLEKHERGFVHQGLANYREIIQAEASASCIERLPNAEEERRDKTRDQVRSIVRGLFARKCHHVGT
jgi:hypothetical protein